MRIIKTAALKKIIETPIEYRPLVRAPDLEQGQAILDSFSGPEKQHQRLLNLVHYIYLFRTADHERFHCLYHLP